MTVTKIKEEHLAQIAAIERACFTEPWSEQALALLLSDDADGVVAVEEGRVAAYGGMIYSPFDAQVTNIAVLPDFRRRGYGRAVLEEMIRTSRMRGVEEMSLEVRASNGAAICLYEEAGFVIAGRRKGFYRSPCEDALVMLLNLKNDSETL